MTLDVTSAMQRKKMSKSKKWIFTALAGLMIAAMLIGLSMRSNAIVSRATAFSIEAEFDRLDQSTPADSANGTKRPTALYDFEETTTKAAPTQAKNHRMPVPDAVSSAVRAVTHPPGMPSKQYKYPDWFEWAWPRTAVSGLQHVFVGDKPLFAPCTTETSEEKGYPFEEPRNYIQETKNPCWYERPREKRGLRCAPYFYLAGTAKGGTTDLYRRIRLHPDVMIGTQKEYHWWDRERYRHLSKDEDTGVIRIRGGVSLRDYTDKIMGSELREVLDDLHEKGTSDKLFGDGSPSYLWDTFYWVVLDGNQGCMEPRISTGQHIRHFYPDAKIILTFRHPTPRLYSRFLSRIPRTPELRKATSKDFHGYVVQGIQAYKTCFSKWSIRHCAYNHTLYKESTVRLFEGFYPVFMADWLRIWPIEQMLILRYEDYSKDTRGVLQKTFDFLNLAPLTEEQWSNVTAIEPLNVGDMYEKIGKLLPETKAILDEFYEPFVHKFAELLNDDRFYWSDTTH